MPSRGGGGGGGGGGGSGSFKSICKPKNLPRQLPGLPAGLRRPCPGRLRAWAAAAEGI